MRNFIWLYFLSVLFNSCKDNEKPNLLGKLPITGVDNIFFKVYQEDKQFEDVVGIYYEIVDKQDLVIKGMELLCGTSDFDSEDTKRFFTGSQDSLIYLSFVNPNDVYVIYDLRSNKTCGDVPCEEAIISKLKKGNPNLKIK